MSDCRICENATYDNLTGLHHCIPQRKICTRGDLNVGCPFFSEWSRRKAGGTDGTKEKL